LGETVSAFFGIMRELYRICRAGAEVHITVPHPRHDDFITDPTHVRAITPQTLDLFSKSKNHEWIKNKHANSPLGLYLDVDFEVANSNYILDPVWADKLNSKEITDVQIDQAFRNFNNVVKEIKIVLKVVK
jgi:hypothetical protein